MSEQKPALAGLVRAGDAQAEAVAITDFIFMAKDISNAYLVTTGDGDLLVNTGFMDNADRNVALFAPYRTGPLRRIVLTQSHADHFGGLDAFREDGTQVIAGPGFVENWADMKRLQPFFGPRSGKLWGGTLKRGSTPKPPPEVVPDVIVDRSYAFEQGGRRFEVIHTPEGEATDGVTVWLPDEKIAFTGNLFGPVFLSMPFLCTIRGDKPRSVRQYLKSLETVRALGAELLVTGHGDPIAGKDRIAADLDRMHAAVAWVRDYTLAGMNAGTTVHQLMRDVALPEELKIGEFHGKVSWAVRTIWEEYAGWFRYEEGTTGLYGVPRSAVNADLAELAGNDALVARAQAHLDTGKPLEAIHLLDIIPEHRDAIVVKKAALEQLLAKSGGSNLSETMWLKAEIAAAEGKLA
ncbi:MBL fold metallo-hydrolase [Sphingomonas sp. G-3-2-10]|uniref:MBL fold metallo-hydrolase n=1 Tax=Sphingomonas sp. G-3-2-10 TaxID=2728838 RepID=UPI00146F293B|nr:MBL fold metallo-hydrolase [Sphingomonas sp. G-3-2-10]NML05737.1 MBL fold metallo-hydrolase [Sphingomonas sp. G-3-2-10]